MMRATILLAALVVSPFAFAQSIPAPSSTLPPGMVVERYTEEQVAFRNAACRDRPNGYYCGTGTNRQLMYQCVDGQISNELSCPGGCNPATMSCAQEFGVKGIDPPKPN